LNNPEIDTARRPYCRTALVSFQVLWEMDKRTRVIEPNPPNFRLTSRRLYLDQYCSVLVEVNSSHPKEVGNLVYSPVTVTAAPSHCPALAVYRSIVGPSRARRTAASTRPRTRPPLASYANSLLLPRYPSVLTPHVTQLNDFYGLHTGYRRRTLSTI